MQLFTKFCVVELSLARTSDRIFTSMLLLDEHDKRISTVLKGVLMNRKLAVLFATVVVSSSLLYGQTQGASGTPEVWGGRDISMVISGENVTLEFDCAQGVVMAPIKPDASGNFSVAGTYTPQRGGPVMKDNPPQDLPATYKGTIQGDTMHLEVLLQDKSQQPPAFTLTKGQAGRVVKCR